MNTTEPIPAALLSLTADDLMTRDVISIPESASLKEAVATLIDHGFSGAPVINAAGRAVGVISQSDVLAHDRNRAEGMRRVPEYYGRAAVKAAADEVLGCGEIEALRPVLVRDVMTPAVFSVGPQTPVRRVIGDLLQLRVHRLFVVDRDGVLVGVIGTTDILRRLLD